MSDLYRTVLLTTQRNIEVVLQFIILGFAIFGCGLAAYEAYEQMQYGAGVRALRSSSDIRTAAFGLLAGYLGVVTVLMLIMPFVNDKISFVPPGPRWGFPVIALGVTAVLSTFIILKTTVLERVDHIDESAIYILKGMKTFKEVRDGKVGAEVFSMDRNSSLDGFSFSFWLGLPNTQDVLKKANAAAEDKVYKIPLILRGVPEVWTVRDQPKQVLVKSPVIYLVLKTAHNPYFEIEFNHMETEGAPGSAGLPATEDIGCRIVDRITAKCTFLGHKSTELESEKLLLAETGEDDRAVLHHVSIVFAETYRHNPATNKKDLFTEIRLFINGKSLDVNYFQGQIRQAATYVGLLPANAFNVEGTSEAQAALLATSRICDVRFFSYALPEGRIYSLYREGYSAAPQQA